MPTIKNGTRWRNHMGELVEVLDASPWLVRIEVLETRRIVHIADPISFLRMHTLIA